jgi:hypothetical protein
MNASSRTARQIIKARRAAAKDNAKGLHTLKSHCLRAGLNDDLAGGVAGALRSKGKSCGITGRAAVMVRQTAAGVRPVKGARRFSRVEFQTLAAAYNPRAAKYVAAREQLLSI